MTLKQSVSVTVGGFSSGYSRKMNRKSSIINQLIRDRWLYLMLIPGVLYFAVFKYFPMWGILIAFQDYQPYLGFFGSKWVGFSHFQRLFADPDFFNLLKNTLKIAAANLILYFPLPIIVSLMLHEVKNTFFKRVTQTIIYIPHFMSWVVVVGISYLLFTTEHGIVNDIIQYFGGEKIQFLMSEKLFLPMYIFEIIWKECGWGTVLFLAALAGVDIQIYEAARIDGAKRLQQLWYITLPYLKSTIIVLLLLRLGTFLDTGFEQIYNMQNAMNRHISEVFDTFVYTMGVTQAHFSYTTAVGLFKSVIGMILVMGSNWIAKRFGEEGLF